MPARRSAAPCVRPIRFVLGIPKFRLGRNDTNIGMGWFQRREECWLPPGQQRCKKSVGGLLWGKRPKRAVAVNQRLGAQAFDERAGGNFRTNRAEFWMRA